MSAPATPTTDTTPETAPVAAVTTPVADEPVVAPKPGPVKRSLEDSLADLPDETREYVLGEVAKARNEAKNLRGRTKTAEELADAARNDVTQQIGKALGLIKDDEKVDPAALAEQLTAERTTSRQAKVELAVYMAAGAVGADAAALLDSRRFVDTLAGVDPTDGDAVKTAVEAAVTANAGFKTAPERRLPGTHAGQGTSALGAPSLDDQIAAAKKAGDIRGALHLENQKLTAPSRQ